MVLRTPTALLASTTRQYFQELLKQYLHRQAKPYLSKQFFFNSVAKQCAVFQWQKGNHYNSL